VDQGSLVGQEVVGDVDGQVSHVDGPFVTNGSVVVEPKSSCVASVLEQSLVDLTDNDLSHVVHVGSRHIGVHSWDGSVGLISEVVKERKTMFGVAKTETNSTVEWCDLRGVELSCEDILAPALLGGDISGG